MTNMGVRAALTIFLLFIATVKADEGGVTFWREEFTMHCPAPGDWYEVKDKDSKLENYGPSHTVKYVKRGHYYCDIDGTKYNFYVQGKVCENCYELDAFLFGCAITVDILVTTAVMIVVYKFTKKRSSAGLTHTSKAPARSGGRAPPVPSPDYEQLNVHTRSQDTYSMVNRMG